MRQFLVGLGCLALPMSCLALIDHPDLSTEQNKLSYSLGVNVGEHFRDQYIEINPEAFASGVQDGLLSKKSALSNEEMSEVLAAFQQKQYDRSQERNKQLSKQNLSESKIFLDGNKKQKGVHTLPSGLQYRIVKEGKGNPPGPHDFVTVNYRGKLINGSEFDSSYQRKSPTTFAVDAVIAGWSEALQHMKPGAQWVLYIPPELAYGEQGAGRTIGPNSALIFDVELLAIKNKLPQAQDKSGQPDPYVLEDDEEDELDEGA